MFNPKLPVFVQLPFYVRASLFSNHSADFLSVRVSQFRCNFSFQECACDVDAEQILEGIIIKVLL
jgi:hypothetical protein